MEISQLTFIVTDDCNYKCSYCFQEKEKKTIDNSTIATAVDFFYPFFKEDNKIDINFYGGEPLLAYDQIKYAVNLLQEKNKTGAKNIAFSLTTNGSLLQEETLDFLNRHGFGLMLSFDGLAQDKGRKKGTVGQMVQVMKRIPEYPGIDFEINSVFTPATLGELTESLRFMIRQGGTEITFNCSTLEEWTPADLQRLNEELERLTDFLVLLYQKTGRVPVKNYQPFIPGESKGRRKGIFRCYAGQDRMAVTPGGNLWGCYLFHDYFKTREDHPQYRDYLFGPLTDFLSHNQDRYPGILANYSELRQDYFQVERGFCFLCEYVEGCVVCPVNAAYTSGALEKVTRRKCELIKIQRDAQRNFCQKLRELSGGKPQKRSPGLGPGT